MPVLPTFGNYVWSRCGLRRKLRGIHTVGSRRWKLSHSITGTPTHNFGLDSRNFLGKFDHLRCQLSTERVSRRGACHTAICQSTTSHDRNFPPSWYGLGCAPTAFATLATAGTVPHHVINSCKKTPLQASSFLYPNRNLRSYHVFEFYPTGHESCVRHQWGSGCDTFTACFHPERCAHSLRGLRNDFWKAARIQAACRRNAQPDASTPMPVLLSRVDSCRQNKGPPCGGPPRCALR